MFRLYGQVKGANRVRLEKVKIAVNGRGFEKDVSPDSKGLYSIDLPLGRYSIEATLPDERIYYFPYKRPLFQVVRPGSLVIDITLRAAGSCDIGFVSGGVRINSSELSQQDQAAIQSQMKNSCGGTDSFALPSKTHVPFEVVIDYSQRDSTREPEFTYEGRISVAYNLFTLTANTVVYDSPGACSTHVKDKVISQEDGVSFRLKDGKTIPYSPAE